MYFLFLFEQLNDSLLYTTPVATGNFKLNNILSLAELKVRFFVYFEIVTVKCNPAYYYDFFVCFFCFVFTWIFLHIYIHFRMSIFYHCLYYAQVSKPTQEGYQNELNIESVERSFILSAR